MYSMNIKFDSLDISFILGENNIIIWSTLIKQLTILWITLGE